MESFLESLHTDHVLCEFERLAFCLYCKLSVEKKIKLMSLQQLFVQSPY